MDINNTRWYSEGCIGNPLPYVCQFRACDSTHYCYYNNIKSGPLNAMLPKFENKLKMDMKNLIRSYNKNVFVPSCSSDGQPSSTSLSLNTTTILTTKTSESTSDSTSTDP